MLSKVFESFATIDLNIVFCFKYALSGQTRFRVRLNSRLGANSLCSGTNCTMIPAIQKLRAVLEMSFTRDISVKVSGAFPQWASESWASASMLGRTWTNDNSPSQVVGFALSL